jgi:hypothetical protein
MTENKPFAAELTPEMILAVLRSMPEVILAEYRNGKFLAQTLKGTAEIKFFFSQKGNEGNV